MKFRKGFVSNSSSSSYIVSAQEEPVIIDPPEFEEELKGYRKSNMNRLNPNRYASEPQEIEASIKKMLGLVKKGIKPAQNMVAVDPKFGPLVEDTQRYELIDPQNNHYKFWEIAVFQNGYITHWGRIGAKPSTTPKYSVGAWREADTKIQEKKNKGYTRQGTPVISYK